MTTIPSITPFSGSPPQTSDPTNFDARMDTTLAEMFDIIPEQNLAIAAMNTVAGEVSDNADTAAAEALAAEASALAALNATTGMRRSTATLSIGVGSKNLTGLNSPSAASFTIDDEVLMVDAENRSNAQWGTVTAVNAGAGTATVDVPANGFIGSGSPDNWIVAYRALAPTTTIGRQQIWFPAAGMTPRTTTGAASVRVETATNKINLDLLDFDPSANEYAQFTLRMPKSWDGGAVYFVPVWEHAATTVNFGVTWGLRAVAISNADASDAAMGTAQYSDDTGGTTGTVYVGPESAAITIGGTPAAEDLVVFEVFRNVAAGNDTMAIDARLIGLTLVILTNRESDQ